MANDGLGFVAIDLATSDLLPPIRQLAGDLGIAANTVARAYRELESDGFVIGRGRRGTVVVGAGAPAAHGPLDEAAARLAEIAKRDGMSLATVFRSIAQAMR